VPDVLSQDDNVLSFDPRPPFLTAPDAGGPVAAPGPPLNLGPQIADERRQAQEAFGLAQQSMAREESDAAAREKELAPLRQRQMQMAMSGIDRAEAAQQALEAKTQKPPEPPQRQNQHDDENWLFAAGLLGSLAGAFTRNHATNALAAFSGAMQGYQEGSREKFDQNMKIWEAENKKVIETNKAAQDEYRSILENNKFTMDQMSVALQVAGAKYEDRGMVTAAKTKNELVIAQYHDQNVRAMEQVEATYGRLSGAYKDARIREQEKWKQDAADWVVGPAGQARFNSIMSGLQNAPPPNSRTTALGFRDSVLRDELSAAGYDFGKFNVDQRVRTQEALIPGRVKAAGATAGERAGDIRAANLEAASRSAAPLIAMAAEAANHVPATAFPRLNSILQATSEELGDPAMVRFKFANMELGRLIARVINPSSSTITNYQAQAAAELFLTASNPDGYQAGLEQAKGLIEREYKAAQEQKSHEPLSPIEIPPISPNRRATAGELLGKAGERAAEGAGGLGLPKTPKYGIGSMVPKPTPPPSSGANMPMMLPEGWSVKELQ
jgi:hypothetical protein